METEEMKRWNVQGGSIQKLGVGLGACCLFAGVLYLAAYVGGNDVVIAPIDANDRVAVETVKDRPSVNMLQAAIDASPAVPSPPAAKPAAVAIRHVAPKLAESPAKSRKEEAAVVMPSGVARFDSCLPECETRDPLIAEYHGTSRDFVPVNAPADDEEEVEFGVSPLREAGHMFDSASEASGKVLRRGRQALHNLIPVNW
ncbi:MULTISPECIES: hypothetical protein [unclassified Sinorhizobium]|uniref:hypothetical protein n=1 Tax=unclassified Sinorhizobium TaxID=2613772 RepID=UPI0035253D0F